MLDVLGAQVGKPVEDALLRGSALEIANDHVDGNTSSGEHILGAEPPFARLDLSYGRGRTLRGCSSGVATDLIEIERLDEDGLPGRRSPTQLPSGYPTKTSLPATPQFSDASGRGCVEVRTASTTRRMCRT